MKENFIEHKLKSSNLFFEPVDILEHMFCVLGNGIDENSLSGFTIPVGYFKDMVPISLCNIYEYSDNEMWQPFQKLAKIENPDLSDGLKEAVEYFIKCLEITDFDSIMSRVENYQIKMTGHFWSHVKNELELCRDSLTNDLRDWKAAIPKLRHAFGIFPYQDLRSLQNAIDSGIVKLLNRDVCFVQAKPNLPKHFKLEFSDKDTWWSCFTVQFNKEQYNLVFKSHESTYGNQDFYEYYKLED